MVSDNLAKMKVNASGPQFSAIFQGKNFPTSDSMFFTFYQFSLDLIALCMPFSTIVVTYGRYLMNFNITCELKTNLSNFFVNFADFPSV